MKMNKKFGVALAVLLGIVVTAGSIAAYSETNENLLLNQEETETEENSPEILTGEGVLVGRIDSHSVKIEGIFTGLADGHTAEFKIDGEYRAYGLAENIDFSGIDVGEKLWIVYQENENGREEIIKIEIMD